MTPCQTVEEAVRAVQQHDGPPEDLELAVDNCLLDGMGINMAVVCDAILARGWDFDGFEDRGDYRRYRYKELR